jgi:hypothetical protein
MAQHGITKNHDYRRIPPAPHSTFALRNSFIRNAHAA